MFSTQTEDERIFALKPRLSGLVSMFAQGLKSYHDLPLRMAEFGKVHRYNRQAPYMVCVSVTSPRRCSRLLY